MERILLVLIFSFAQQNYINVVVCVEVRNLSFPQKVQLQQGRAAVKHSSFQIFFTLEKIGQFFQLFFQFFFCKYMG